MDKEKLRPIAIGRLNPVSGYFHKWIVRVFSDEPGSERPYALVEMENGSVKEVHAEEIRFIDRD